MEPRVLSEKAVELPGELAAEAGNTAMKSAEIAAKAPQFVRSDGLINLAGWKVSRMPVTLLLGCLVCPMVLTWYAYSGQFFKSQFD